jgi:hypothetical protein
LSGLTEKDEVVKNKFTKPHIYYAGSWQGCGCGWFSDEGEIETEEDRKNFNRTKQSLSELHTTIASLLKTRDKVELFLCWEGSQGEEPRRHITLTVEDLKTDSLPMEELDFADVFRRNEIVEPVRAADRR